MFENLFEDLITKEIDGSDSELFKRFVEQSFEIVDYKNKASLKELYWHLKKISTTSEPTIDNLKLACYIFIILNNEEKLTVDILTSDREIVTGDDETEWKELLFCDLVGRWKLWIQEFRGYCENECVSFLNQTSERYFEEEDFVAMKKYCLDLSADVQEEVVLDSDDFNGIELITQSPKFEAPNY